MADSFQQRIGFEGAEDILAKLKAIGLEGTKAFGDVKKAIESVNPSLAALSTTSQAAQKGIAGFTQALGGLGQVLGPISGSLSGLLTTFTAFGRAGGALAAVGGLVLFTKSAADSVIATQNQARAFGLTVEQLKTLSRAAQQAGVDQEELATALGRFSQRAAAEAQTQAKTLIDITTQIAAKLPGVNIKIFNVDDIKKFQQAVAQAAPQIKATFEQINGVKPSPFLPQFIQQVSLATASSEEFRNSLRALGIEVPATSFLEKASVAAKKLDVSFSSLGISLLGVGTNAKPTFEVFLDFAEKIKNTPDGFQKSALASKVFGRTVGPELIAALNLGRAGIEDIRAELGKLGLTFSEDQVNAARQFRQSIIELDQSMNTFKKTILETFGPALSAGLKSTVTDINRLKQLFSGDVSFFNGSPIDEFIKQFKADFNALPAFVQGVMESVGTGISDGLNKAVPTLGVALEVFKSVFKKAGDDSKASFAERFGDIKPIKGLEEALKKSVAAANLPVVFPGGIASGADKAKQSVDRLSDSIKRIKSEAAEGGPGPNSAFGTEADFGGPGEIRTNDSLAPKLKDITPIGADAAAALQKVGQTADEAATNVKKIADAGGEVQTQYASLDTTGLTTLQTAAADTRTEVAGLATDGSTLPTTYDTAAVQMTSDFNGVTESIKAARAEVDALLASGRQLASLNIGSGGGGGGGDVVGAATGGVIRGPGTGTSDSILAWLSNGEGVLTARALRHYGSGIVHSINNLRMPRFSTGGFVDALNSSLASMAVPRFAAGGLADLATASAGGASSSIVLDLRTDKGRFRGSVMADRDVAEALTRFATIDQITSMGKKSSAF